MRYSLAGDGVDGLTPSEASFAVDAHTGELIQLKVRRGTDGGRMGVGRKVDCGLGGVGVVKKQGCVL